MTKDKDKEKYKKLKYKLFIKNLIRKSVINNSAAFHLFKLQSKMSKRDVPWFSYVLKFNKRHGWHLVDPSPWPFWAAISGLLLVSGFLFVMHDFDISCKCIKDNILFLIFGFLAVLGVMTLWFRDIIREGLYMGHHTVAVQKNLRNGFILFIVSEVMFFAAFFWAFFHSSLSPSIWVGGIWPPLGIVQIYISEDIQSIATDPYSILSETFSEYGTSLWWTYWNYDFYTPNSNVYGLLWESWDDEDLSESLRINDYSFTDHKNFIVSYCDDSDGASIPNTIIDVDDTEEFVPEFLNIDDIEEFVPEFPNMDDIEEFVPEFPNPDDIEEFVPEFINVDTKKKFILDIIKNVDSVDDEFIQDVPRVDEDFDHQLEFLNFDVRSAFLDAWIKTEYFFRDGFHFFLNFDIKNFYLFNIKNLNNSCYQDVSFFVNLFDSALLIDPYGVPMLNTFILLISGAFLTWSHHALRIENFVEATGALIVVVLLGVFFLYVQLKEYLSALFSINDGIYGSTFYMLTGFHGFHVIIGTIFLLTALVRFFFAHFTRYGHLGFETAVWYWHFVDVVWIFLYIFVYLWPNHSFFSHDILLGIDSIVDQNWDGIETIYDIWVSMPVWPLIELFPKEFDFHLINNTVGFKKNVLEKFFFTDIILYYIGSCSDFFDAVAEGCSFMKEYLQLEGLLTVNESYYDIFKTLEDNTVKTEIKSAERDPLWVDLKDRYTNGTLYPILDNNSFDWRERLWLAFNIIKEMSWPYAVGVDKVDGTHEFILFLLRHSYKPQFWFDPIMEVKDVFNDTKSINSGENSKLIIEGDFDKKLLPDNNQNIVKLNEFEIERQEIEKSTDRLIDDLINKPLPADTNGNLVLVDAEDNFKS